MNRLIPILLYWHHKQYFNLNETKSEAIFFSHLYIHPPELKINENRSPQFEKKQMFINETVFQQTKTRTFNAIIRSIYTIPLWGTASQAKLDRLEGTYTRILRGSLVGWSLFPKLQISLRPTLTSLKYHRKIKYIYISPYIIQL